MWSARRCAGRVAVRTPRTNDIDTDERRQTIPAARKADHERIEVMGHRLSSQWLGDRCCMSTAIVMLAQRSPGFDLG